MVRPTSETATPADFGDLNPKNYQLLVDSVKVNNMAYVVQEYVQVVNGGVKQKETKVTDHSGTFTLLVRSAYNNNQPLKNVGVIIIPSNKFNYSSSTAFNLKIADFSGVTNDNGLITLKIPSNKSYTVYLYNTVTNSSYNNNSNLYVQKDGTASYSVNVYQ